MRQEIEAANAIFMAAFGRGDAAGLAALYTADGQLLPTNSDVVSGSAAIQEFWQGAIDMGLKKATLDTVEVDDCGNTAVEVGRYTLIAGDDSVADAGKYVVIWKRQDGGWKLHRDIWNTSQPAQS